MFNHVFYKIKDLYASNSLKKAIRWVKNNRRPQGGIVVHHKTKNETPEVTGYLISSLYEAGEKDFAIELARWEMGIQKNDGSFAAPGSDVSYTFDTAQVIRGFLSVLDDMPAIESNLRKACDYVCRQIDENGEVHTADYKIWKLPNGSYLSVYCNLYNLPPLISAGERLKEKRYVQTAQRALNFYKQKSDLTVFKPELGTLSHIFGYMMEALIDLKEKELTAQGMKQVEKMMAPDGSIPAYPGVSWICSTGMAQLGITWAKMGEMDKAEKILTYLEKLQNPSGGFYGSYGDGGEYFPGKEISWANKFFIDLYLLVRGTK